MLNLRHFMYINNLFFLFVDAKKFNQCYMLARELGSGAFSVVKLGINLVTALHKLSTFS